MHPAPDGIVDLASNDYLGLSGDERLAEAAAAAARRWGTGSTGSRLVTGTTELHTELEHELAAFSGAAAALVFSSGYLANLAVITALAQALGTGRAGPGVLIVSDAANHASLIDACRLARARVVVTPHADPRAVEQALARRTEPAAIVVSDTVFSVTGDQAPVAELHRAARAHQALLVLDEAHAFGVLGPGGRGVAAAAGIAGDPHVVRTLTLSKSLAGQGGAVTGARRDHRHAHRRGARIHLRHGPGPAERGGRPRRAGHHPRRAGPRAARPGQRAAPRGHGRGAGLSGSAAGRRRRPDHARRARRRPRGPADLRSSPASARGASGRPRFRPARRACA